MSYCCERFEEQTGTLKVAPPNAAIRPVPQFERLESGAWGINGCCGGGCFVVSEMRYCPYCGARVDVEGIDD